MDSEIKKYITNLIKNPLDQNTGIPIMNTNTPYNRNSILVLMYFIQKSIEYFKEDKPGKRIPENLKDLRYGRYFGIPSDITSLFDDSSM